MKYSHTKIPNAVLERLMRENLGPYENRVLKAIWRKTWGWHKDEDAISVSQIQSMTKLDRRHTVRTLKRLRQRKLAEKKGRRLVKGRWIDIWKPCIASTGNAKDAKDDFSEMEGTTALPLQDAPLPLQAHTKEIF